MDDGSRGFGPKRETIWPEREGNDDFRDWLQQIHREAVEHTESIHRRQALPNWVRG